MLREHITYHSRGRRGTRRGVACGRTKFAVCAADASLEKKRCCLVPALQESLVLSGERPGQGQGPGEQPGSLNCQTVRLSCLLSCLRAVLTLCASSNFSLQIPCTRRGSRRSAVSAPYHFGTLVLHTCTHRINCRACQKQFIEAHACRPPSHKPQTQNLNAWKIARTCAMARNCEGQLHARSSSYTF